MFGKWHRALRSVSPEAVVKHVRIIGTDDPSLRRLVLKRFPGATVNEPGKVDLVVVGSQTMTDAEAETRLAEIVKELDRYGHVFVDRGAHPTILAGLFKTYVREPVTRKTGKNIYLYRPHGAGVMGDPLPEGFGSFYACKQYIERDVAGMPRFELTGQEGCWGSRWHFGPLWFEKYYNDTEPTIRKDGPLRLVVWQPMSRMDYQKGWRRTRLTNHIRMTGFATVNPTNYTERWTSHAKRHRDKWNKQKADWEVVHPTLDEFIEAYKKTKFDPVLKYLFIDLLNEKRKTQIKNLKLFGVRKKGSVEIEAGFACVDIPEVNQSKHLISFIHEPMKQTSVGTGLMDEWFQHAVQQGYQFLDFGVFWAPGDPKDWKGFSRFKAQFGIHFIKYPYPLVRRSGSVREVIRSMFTR